MKFKKKLIRAVYYRSRSKTVEFGERINSYAVRDFCSAVSRVRSSGTKDVFFDFSRVRKAYPDGMLPVIATVEKLRSEGHIVRCGLPKNDSVRRLFRQVNWAHFLGPDQFEKSESSHDRHLVTRHFTSAVEQTSAVNDFMDVIVRNMILPRNVISGLEWSINEITDNVLNHSNSEMGGFIQATTYPKSKQIAFAVADSGIGILKSLKEAIPTLRTDVQAMGEAVKAGVTRNPSVGQGNGLAGSLRITTQTGGSFEITSGAGRILITAQETTHNNRRPDQSYQGTLVCGQVQTENDFSLIEALDFGVGIAYSPVDFIELQYEAHDQDCLRLVMKDETTGFGSRNSGRQIRTKIHNLLDAEPTYPLVVDWAGVPVISSSFADEMLGKLFLSLGAITFSARIRNVNMDELIKRLLDKAVAQRLVQANDEEFPMS